MEKDINKIIEGTGKIISIAPELYDNGLKPTVQETGKMISLLPKLINSLLTPLWKWVIKREYSLKETEKMLEIKLKNIDESKIVAPETYVAVPALQAISYSMDSKELRNMYANLLAKAMNIDEKEKVHPVFVELIKQMTPKEAIILEEIFKVSITPVIDLYINTGDGALHHRYNITWITDIPYEEVAIALDNLERMGLIQIPAFGTGYTNDSNYDYVRSTGAYSKHKEQLKELNMGNVEEEKKYIKKTALSKSFFEVCIVD